VVSDVEVVIESLVAAQRPSLASSCQANFGRSCVS
jgi:hypothetical protein